MKLNAGIDRYLSVVLVVLLLAALGALVYIVTVPKESEKFTEFYILGEDGEAGHYPEEVVQGGKYSVILGVENKEYEKQSYIVEVWIGEEKAGIWLEETEMEELSFYLADKEIWENEISITMSDYGNNQMIEFRLYKEGDSEAYRTLHLYVDVIQS